MHSNSKALVEAGSLNRVYWLSAVVFIAVVEEGVVLVVVVICSDIERPWPWHCPNPVHLLRNYWRDSVPCWAGLLAASLALRSCKLILHDGVIDIDFRLLIYLVTRLNNNTNVWGNMLFQIVADRAGCGWIGKYCSLSLILPLAISLFDTPATTVDAKNELYWRGGGWQEIDHWEGGGGEEETGGGEESGWG